MAHESLQHYTIRVQSNSKENVTTQVEGEWGLNNTGLESKFKKYGQ
jgi:hypothetical protein